MKRVTLCPSGVEVLDRKVGRLFISVNIVYVHKNFILKTFDDTYTILYLRM